MLTGPKFYSERRVAQLQPLQTLLVEAVDHLGAGDHWSLLDRTNALLTLRLTDHVFCALASAPWRKTWQDKIAASGTKEQIRPAYLQSLNGPNLRRAIRNPFLDAVWNRAPELRIGALDVGGAHVLRYAAGLDLPPKSLMFDVFTSAFLLDLGRWPALTRLSIKDFSDEYRSAQEADISFVPSLFYRYELEAVEFFETPFDYERFFDGVQSLSLTHLTTEALTFHEFAPLAAQSLPNLRHLTLLFREFNLFNTSLDQRITQSLTAVVVEQLTLRWQLKHSLSWWNLNPLHPDFVLPLIPRDHIQRFIFEGFPQNLLEDLFVRSPGRALADVPYVLIRDV